MLEYRQFKNIRKSESRSISGVAAVFESQSEDLGFIEIIHKGAITEETIKKSDIFATLNHDMDKVLARSKYGNGSLVLDVDENGLNYQFDAPNSSLGDEVLEYLIRGDIDSSSFAFSIDINDEEAQRWERVGDQIYRHIFKIERLYDVSPVFMPAYSSTSVVHRNKPSDYEVEINKLKDMEKRELNEQEANQMQNLLDENEALKKKIALLEANKEEKSEEEEKPNEEPKEEPKEEPNQEPEQTEDKSSEESENKPNQEPEQTEEKPNEEENKPAEETADEDKNKDKNNRSNKNMEKQISIVKEIRNAMQNGSNKFELRTMTVDGYTPAGEGADPVTGVHGDVVPTEVKSILEPLYAESVLSKLGATWYQGMPMGDIQVPVMGKGTVGWAGEIATASESKNTFTHITLKPKRLTAYVDISKKLIAQDTIGVEAAIRRDIVNALQDKFEATVLGAGAKTDEAPAGIFNGAEETTVSDYKGICDLEAGVEENNATGAMTYLLSPKCKAFFKQLAKSTKHTQLVLEGGELDGTPVICTSNVPAKKFVYGNFKDLVLASWDNIEVVVDPYTQATNGCIRLVINAYFDAQIARKDALAFGKIA